MHACRKDTILLWEQIPSGDRLLFALDDTPTKRYGPKAQGAGIHHNPNLGPADAKFLYGHIWVPLAWIVRHPLGETIGLPLLAKLYVRQKRIPRLPKKLRWPFYTKLQLAAQLMEWLPPLVSAAGKQLWIVVDGFYAKRPFLKAARKLNVPVISRLRKDATLWTLPPMLQKGQRRGRGQPRKSGTSRISLAKRASQSRGWKTTECVQYGQKVTKKYKTFLATYRPAYGLIHVVMVPEPTGVQFFFSINPNATVQKILEAFADRAAIEQDFHDLKQLWGAGQQQVRYLWANLGVWHLNLWMHMLVELWAWDKPKQGICDRSASPWDDPTRRPSHADRHKAWQRSVIQQEYLAIACLWALPRRIHHFTSHLIHLAV
jgi:hypothetical protein